MQTGLICFELMARINRVPIDMQGIVRMYGLNADEISVAELLRVAKGAGFRAKLKHLRPEAFGKNYPVPAIAVRKDGSYCILLQINLEEKAALVFSPEDKAVNKVSLVELKETVSGDYIVAKHRLMSAQVKFGFAWFYKEILNYKKIIGEVLLASFFVQLFALATPLFIQVVIDKVLVHHSLATLEVLAVAFVAVVVFELLLNLARNYLFIHTANKIDAKLGSNLFRHLFSLPYVYFENRKVGNIVARIRELDNIRDFITNKTVSVIIDLMFSFVFLVVMLLHSVSLTLIVLGFVAVIAIIFLVVTPELRRRLEDKFQMAAHSQSYLVESITGVETVKSLAIEGSVLKKWENHLGNYIRSSFNLSNMSKISGAISGFLQKLMTLAVLYFGVGLVIENKLSVGQLIAFNMFSRQLTGPIIRLVNLWNEFQQALLSVDRLCDILNNPSEIQSTQSITLPKIDGEIRFDNVSFKYLPDTPNVLDRLSFNINPGMSVGLVGRSGSGKSTIAKIIQRLYSVRDGAVYLDGVDIRHLHPAWLRNNIGVVLQENYLFSGSIRENIAMARPEAPAEVVIQAARIAGAHEFVMEMPEGYDTMVGERGSTLSGGQRQRIAIARAIIKDPRILIFDEATSALDYESESLIQKNISRIKAGRTTVFIAHRLSTVRHCDLLLVIEKGRIIEGGSHDELIAKKGAYYKLHSQQEAMMNA